MSIPTLEGTPLLLLRPLERKGTPHPPVMRGLRRSIQPPNAFPAKTRLTTQLSRLTKCIRETLILTRWWLRHRKRAFNPTHPHTNGPSVSAIGTNTVEPTTALTTQQLLRAQTAFPAVSPQLQTFMCLTTWTRSPCRHAMSRTIPTVLSTSAFFIAPQWSTTN